MSGKGGGGHVQYTLHVSDAVVPAILGRGGQVIKEMQEQSGASIKVSQKGDYVPGTSLRIITISGNQVLAVPPPTSNSFWFCFVPQDPWHFAHHLLNLSSSRRPAMLRSHA